MLARLRSRSALRLPGRAYAGGLVAVCLGGVALLATTTPRAGADGTPSLSPALATLQAAPAAPSLPAVPPALPSLPPGPLPAGGQATACATPAIAAVETDPNAQVSAGNTAPMGPQSGPPGTWLTIRGTGMASTTCTTTVYVGSTPQPMATPTPAGAVPPGSVDGTVLTIATSGASGRVSVVLCPAGVSCPPPASPALAGVPAATPSPPASPTPAPPPGETVSNDNFTFLAPPSPSSFSDAHPVEAASETVGGTGFTAGGIVAGAELDYATGTDATAQCWRQPAAVVSDTTLTSRAPDTFCAGQVSVRLVAPMDLTKPATDPANQDAAWAVVPGTVQVAAIVDQIFPTSAHVAEPVWVIGSGFGTTGTATVDGNAATVRFWSDREVGITIPAGASAGRVSLRRSDASLVDAGTVQILPGLAPSTSPPPGGPTGTGLSQGSSIAAGALAVGLGSPRYGPPAPLGPPPPKRPAPGGGGKGPGGGTSPASAQVGKGDRGDEGPVIPFLTGPLNLVLFAEIAAAVVVLALLVLWVRSTRRIGGWVRRRVLARLRRRRAPVLSLVRPHQVPAIGAAAATTASTSLAARILRLPFRHRRLEAGEQPVHVPLGHLLLGRGAIDRHDLRRALHIQRTEGGRLGEILVAAGYAHEDQVWAALGQQWHTPLRHLDHHWSDPALTEVLPPVDAVAMRVLPLRRCRAGVLVAMTDVTDVETRTTLESRFGAPIIPVLATPTAIRERQEQVWEQRLVEDSCTLLLREEPDASANRLLTEGQRRTLIGLGVFGLVGFAALRGSFAIDLVGAVILLYAAVVVFRTWIIVHGARHQDVITVSRDEVDALRDLPVYTILCPLYREAGVLPQLVKACSDLDYPKRLLDVKLLLEADDVETLRAVRDYPLPAFFDVVVVPADGPRTKPKACNYGLQFARGEYCVIYDAEDIPDPDQLKKALAVFRRSDERVACVQAKLNFYNPQQNWLTAWFALEYTSWFDLFLPGLVALQMPVPLGGSSNHFPTALLRELHGWDPDNVTEDADLGMRVHRAGYRTLLMDSTTLEEANSDFVNWVRQRSRWGKGYAVSWLVQMRHPRRLFQAVGWKSFVAIQLLLGGTFGVAVLNLGAWSLTVLWGLTQLQFIQALFPGWIYYAGMLEMLIGNFFYLYLALWCVEHRRSWEMTRVALTAPAYWVMQSLAMIKAGMQLFTAPTFWEKTVHGLYETTAEQPEAPAAEAADEVAELPAAAGGEAG